MMTNEQAFDLVYKRKGRIRWVVERRRCMQMANARKWKSSIGSMSFWFQERMIWVFSRKTIEYMRKPGLDDMPF